MNYLEPLINSTTLLNKTLKKQINYIAPAYLPNIGEIIIIKKPHEAPMKILMSAHKCMLVIKQHCSPYSMEVSSKILATSELLPMVIKYETAFLRVKIRNAIIENDVTYAFVNLTHIKQLEFKDSSHTTIVFKDNSKLCTLQTPSTIKKKITDCMQVYSDLLLKEPHNYRSLKKIITLHDFKFKSN